MGEGVTDIKAAELAKWKERATEPGRQSYTVQVQRNHRTVVNASDFAVFPKCFAGKCLPLNRSRRRCDAV